MGGVHRRRSRGRLGGIGGIERLQVFLDVMLDAFKLLVKALWRINLLAGGHGRKLTAINGHELGPKERLLATEQRECPAHSDDGLRVVLAEVGDGLEVGAK